MEPPLASFKQMAVVNDRHLQANYDVSFALNASRYLCLFRLKHIERIRRSIISVRLAYIHTCKRRAPRTEVFQLFPEALSYRKELYIHASPKTDLEEKTRGLGTQHETCTTKTERTSVGIGLRRSLVIYKPFKPKRAASIIARVIQSGGSTLYNLALADPVSSGCEFVGVKIIQMLFPAPSQV